MLGPDDVEDDEDDEDVEDDARNCVGRRLCTTSGAEGARVATNVRTIAFDQSIRTSLVVEKGAWIGGLRVEVCVWRSESSMHSIHSMQEEGASVGRSSTRRVAQGCASFRRVAY